MKHTFFYNIQGYFIKNNVEHFDIIPDPTYPTIEKILVTDNTCKWRIDRNMDKCDVDINQLNHSYCNDFKVDTRQIQDNAKSNNGIVPRHSVSGLSWKNNNGKIQLQTGDIMNVYIYKSTDVRGHANGEVGIVLSNPKLSINRANTTRPNNTTNTNTTNTRPNTTTNTTTNTNTNTIDNSNTQTTSCTGYRETQYNTILQNNQRLENEMNNNNKIVNPNEPITEEILNGYNKLAIGVLSDEIIINDFNRDFSWKFERLSNNTFHISTSNKYVGYNAELDQIILVDKTDPQISEWIFDIDLDQALNGAQEVERRRQEEEIRRQEEQEANAPCVRPSDWCQNGGTTFTQEGRDIYCSDIMGNKWEMRKSNNCQNVQTITVDETNFKTYIEELYINAVIAPITIRRSFPHSFAVQPYNHKFVNMGTYEIIGPNNSSSILQIFFISRGYYKGKDVITYVLQKGVHPQPFSDSVVKSIQ